jgi:glutamate-5-semialdehyde dehydrogenase
LALKVIINGKTAKISACNAVDKVLINSNLPNKESFIKTLVEKLMESKVEVLGDKELAAFENISAYTDENIWYEEFLDYKIVIGSVPSTEAAISKINTYGGGHSAVIITTNNELALEFMESVDSAAVYQNASTRFTDGGQFGLGGELAISTDKLHHRGPMGLQHLVTNKWFIYGNGQIR